MQDYMSLRLAVMICGIVVNTQTDTHREAAFDQLHYKLSQRS